MALVNVNWNPDGKQLRMFGLAGLVAFGALGAWVFFRQSLIGFELAGATARIVAYGLWALAAFCGLAAAAAPKAVWPLYLLLTVVALPIGFVLSYVILAVLFFGIFTPMALFFRLIGRDVLCRKFDRAAETYWVRKDPTPETRRYFRQF